MSKKIKIGSLGRFVSRKGQQYIIEALPYVISKIDKSDIELWFAGEGPLQHELEKRAHQLGVGKHIKFLGTVQDVRKFLDDIDILVHAAVSGEAFCYAALEGLAAGKVVVATNTDGIPEYIQDHLNGLLVPIKSPESIANAVIEVINKPDLFECLSKNAAESCRPYFSTERMVDETFSFYNDILKEV